MLRVHFEGELPDEEERRHAGASLEDPEHGSRQAGLFQQHRRIDRRLRRQVHRQSRRRRRRRRRQRQLSLARNPISVRISRVLIKFQQFYIFLF